MQFCTHWFSFCSFTRSELLAFSRRYTNREGYAVNKIGFAAAAALMLMASATVSVAGTPTAPERNSQEYQHSGGTDANGCHKNHKTGGYHCH